MAILIFRDFIFSKQQGVSNTGCTWLSCHNNTLHTARPSLGQREASLLAIVLAEEQWSGRVSEETFRTMILQCLAYKALQLKGSN